MNVRSIRAPFAFLVAIALVTLLRAAPAQAAPLALELGEGFSSAIVGRSLDLALDVPGTASLDEVLAGKVQFTPSEKDVPSFGYRHGVEWAHLRVTDLRSGAGSLVLEHGYGLTDSIELFEVEGGRVLRHARLGDHVPVAEWDVDARFPAFKLASRPEHDLYLRIDSQASHQLSFTLYEPEAYEAHRRHDLVLQSLYFGSLAAMLLYNALVWLATGGRAYGFYVGFLAAYGFFQFGVSGFLPMMGATGLAADLPIPLIMALVGGFGLRFASELLDLASLAPRVNRLVLVQSGVNVVAIAAGSTWGYRVGIHVALAFAFAWAVSQVAVGVVALVRGSRVAKLYLLAWGALLAGSLLNLFLTLGVVPKNNFTSNAMQLGSVLEFLLLSFALADRIKQLQEQATYQAELAREASHNAHRASEEKALAEARAADELRRLDKLKDEFLANTSHELRTPLNGVIGLADSLLAMGDELPKSAVQGLRTILASGKRLDRLVSDVLDFSKAKSGDLSVEMVAVDLSASVSEALLLLAPTVGRKTIRLVNEVAANFPLARADETRLAQVLQHVVGNAIKFTDTGEVRVSAERREGRVVLAVTDTGPGIPEGKLATLFSAFEQGDGSATRAHGGTGLGLAFVKQLMELQRGSVQCAHTSPGGTRMELELAMAPPAAQQARRESVTKVRTIPPPNRLSIAPTSSRASIAPTNLPALGRLPGPALALAARRPLLSTLPNASTRHLIGMAPKALGQSVIRVLIADDEPVNLERLQMDLEHTGYEIVSVGDGQAAVEAYDAQGPFDLVLLDVMMPRLDGLGACRAIRERAAANAVPIVMITAKRETKDMQAGFEAGANDYLTKPYVRQELIERTRSHIGTARMSRAVQRFVPSEFAKLLGHERLDQIALGDCVERELTVLFLDIQGFTQASERMTSRQTFAWLNAQFAQVVPAVRAYGGFVDKFIGDALMGLFPKGAITAVDAAAHAIRLLSEHDVHARVGIGLHHGPTMLGAIGDGERFSPTVVSDTVNVAARLETLTRRFDARVLLSEETLEAAGLGRSGRTRYVGAFRLKGRAKALRVHELLDADDPVTAADKRSASELLTRMHRELDGGDLDSAWASASEGYDLYPNDAVIAFYRVALESMLRLGQSYDGAIDLKEK